MKIHLFGVAMLPFVLIGVSCSQHSGMQHSGTTVSGAVIIERSSGAVAPAYAYSDQITISGNSLQVSRSGGSGVVTGTWTVRLTKQEIAEINQLYAAISASQDADIITGPPFPVGGGNQEMQISSQIYRNGVIVMGEGLHSFSPDLQAFYDVIVDLMVTHEVEVVYSTSG